MRILEYCTPTVLDAGFPLVKAFIRATWLFDTWNLLPKVMDVTLEFANSPFAASYFVIFSKAFFADARNLFVSAFVCAAER